MAPVSNNVANGAAITSYLENDRFIRTTARQGWRARTVSESMDRYGEVEARLPDRTSLASIGRSACLFPGPVPVRDTPYYVFGFMRWTPTYASVQFPTTFFEQEKPRRQEHGKPPTWFRRAEPKRRRKTLPRAQSLSRNLPFVNHVTDLMAGADLMREHPAEGNVHSGG